MKSRVRMILVLVCVFVVLPVVGGLVYWACSIVCVSVILFERIDA